jgi:hypothetical protein
LGRVERSLVLAGATSPFAPEGAACATIFGGAVLSVPFPTSASSTTTVAACLPPLGLETGSCITTGGLADPVGLATLAGFPLLQAMLGVSLVGVVTGASFFAGGGAGTGTVVVGEGDRLMTRSRFGSVRETEDGGDGGGGVNSGDSSRFTVTLGPADGGGEGGARLFGATARCSCTVGGGVGCCAGAGGAGALRPGTMPTDRPGPVGICTDGR